MRVRGHTLPSRCYASPWSCVCVGFFLKLLRSPTVASEPRFYALMLYAQVEHKWVVGDTSHTAYQHVILWFSGIVGWSVPDRHYAYAYARLVLPMCFAHRWLAGISFSNFSWTECGYARSLRRLKQHQLDKLSLWFWCVGKNCSCSARSSHVKTCNNKVKDA